MFNRIIYLVNVLYLISELKAIEKFGKEEKLLYEKYKALRDKKGVTDYRVSVETGITKSTFTDWKNGRSTPKIEKLKILADYFGVKIEDFLE